MKIQAGCLRFVKLTGFNNPLCGDLMLAVVYLIDKALFNFSTSTSFLWDLYVTNTLKKENNLYPMKSFGMETEKNQFL